MAIARRKGTDWFLGVMTNSQKRLLDIPLSFLGQGSYRGRLFVDGPNADSDPTSLLVHDRVVAQDTTLTADLAPAGGLAAWFHRQ